jgi:hypothetical protein
MGVEISNSDTSRDFCLFFSFFLPNINTVAIYRQYQTTTVQYQVY